MALFVCVGLLLWAGWRFLYLWWCCLACFAVLFLRVGLGVGDCFIWGGVVFRLEYPSFGRVGRRLYLGDLVCLWGCCCGRMGVFSLVVALFGRGIVI